jgi:hypothetical protein
MSTVTKDNAWGGHAYVRTYVRENVHTYTRTYLRTYVPTYLRTYVPTYLRTYVPPMRSLLCDHIFCVTLLALQ